MIDFDGLMVEREDGFGGEKRSDVVLNGWDG